MFTTRSLSPTVPATRPLAVRPSALREASLVLVGHGSASQPKASRPLLRHAESLRQRELFDGVYYGALFGEPSLAALARRLPIRSTYVVPLLMCDGDYARAAIGALFDRPVDGECAMATICPPIGIHPRLAELIAMRALRALTEAQQLAVRTTLLLIAHGSSRSAASFEAAERQAGRLRELRLFGEVCCAFLDQRPKLSETLRHLEGPLVACGLFAGEGVHVTRDVPEALAAYRAGPLLDLGAVGADPEIADIVLDQVIEAEAARG